MEAMYQFLREQSKKNANIKPVDFSQLFQGKTAYEVLQSVVQGYVNMNHQEKLLTFYKVIYSERSIQPMAARIVAEETERMIISTVLVVMLSIVSLVILIIAGVKRKEYRSFGVFAGIALGMMLVGALGMNIISKEYFGVVERFSVFAAVGYNAVLGVELFRMDLG